MRPFRFGAQVPRAASGKEWADKACKLEGLGFSTLFMPDHFDDQLAPTPALTAAAMATTTLRVGSLVYDNDYRHPLVLAKEAATLDLLSDGRLELGVGAGWMNTDYESSGIQHDPVGVRIDRMVEGIEVMKGLFSGEPFSFSGKHYTITEHTGTPSPVQKPHPPFLVGGGGRRVLGIAGREADIISVNFAMIGGAVGPEALITGSAEATRQKIGWIRDGAGDRFDDIELSVTVFVGAITDHPDNLAEAVGGAFGLGGAEARASAHVLIGTEDEIVETLQGRREEYGFSYVVFSGGCEEAMAPIVARLADT